MEGSRFKIGRILCFKNGIALFSVFLCVIPMEGVDHL